MRPYRHKRLASAVAQIILMALIGLGSPAVLHAGEFPHHDLVVSLDPGSSRIVAKDTVTVPHHFPKTFSLALHAGLNPSSPDPAVRIKKKGERTGAVPLELFIVERPAGMQKIILTYGGAIHHPLIASKNQARAFDRTPGTISSDGTYLAGGSAWYPLLETDFITFNLTVEVPVGWDAVSQGSRLVREKSNAATKVAWDSPEPQNEIYLIASRFFLWEKKDENVTAQVFLRTDDQDLAGKYLDATLRYVALYDNLIGPYPYKKFALVENFWETGFGMPSFTLLGPTVLRLPFIINTSYPHEILHNWWGNSVYPLYDKGNWSEGLTAYLADHLLKEQQGSGAEYRLTTLQKYADYVSDGRDFPLTQFTSRHSGSTEAVGYGKSLMFFHMLRGELGNDAFIAGIRHFYRHNRFRYAGFDDLEKSFENASGRNLAATFDQWVSRVGAPGIELQDVRIQHRAAEKQDESYVLTGTLKQVQKGKSYRLRIPVAVTREGSEKAFQAVVELKERQQEFELRLPSRPLRLDVDPEFDVFRRLDRGEIPPAITQALGAKSMLVILPSDSPQDLLGAYREFAESLSHSGPDEIDVKLDSDVGKLPKDRAVAVLGWENRYLDQARAAWKDYEVTITGGAVGIGKERIARENHCFVLSSRNPAGKDHALLFIAADRKQQIPGLARKLPHYHKYSYLAFEGNEPTNMAKGRWPVIGSPLTVFFKDKEGKPWKGAAAPLAPRDALAAPPPLFSRESMMETVQFLAGDQLRGREAGSEGLERAAEFIAASFKNAGLLPGGDAGDFFQAWEAALTPGKKLIDPSSPECRTGCRTYSGRNVIAVLPGTKKELSGQSVVIGAHYDSLGTGTQPGRSGDKGNVYPGADDNASGVAVLLELARVLKETSAPSRTILFAAFSGEEEGRLGSRMYVQKEETYPVSSCIGMVNLDTVGRLGRKKLLVLGANSAREWVHIFRGAGFATGVEIKTVSEDLDSSDQKSFQEAGIPGVQLFSGAHPDYHRPTDTADKIDGAGLVKAASVAKEAAEYLANRDQPLTSMLRPGRPVRPESRAERTVSLGTIPDFSFSGSGVKLSGVIEGSPAEAAGLKEGDVITAVNNAAVSGLKEFSDRLKTLKPGDPVSVSYKRGGREQTVTTRVKGR